MLAQLPIWNQNMKNLILQHYTGKLGTLEELSIKNISNYAKNIGADYQFLEGQVFRDHLTHHCQKIFMLDPSFDEYDNVMMLDIDMFATNSEKENVFDVPGIGLYEDVQKNLHRQMVNAFVGLSSFDYPYWGGAIYKMDLQTRQHLREGFDKLKGLEQGKDNPYLHYDEGIMHLLACVTKFKSEHNYLPRKWCYCSFLFSPETAGFIHVRTKVTPNGPRKTKLENLLTLVDKGIITI